MDKINIMETQAYGRRGNNKNCPKSSKNNTKVAKMKLRRKKKRPAATEELNKNSWASTCFSTS